MMDGKTAKYGRKAGKDAIKDKNEQHRILPRPPRSSAIRF
jgi:hypothetical protein